MIALRCQSCGAPMPLEGSTCLYCGTNYAFEDEETPQADDAWREATIWDKVKFVFIAAILLPIWSERLM